MRTSTVTDWSLFKKADLREPQCLGCVRKSQGPFCGLETGIVSRLGRAKAVSLVGKGQILFQAGSPVSSVYCLHSGFAKIYRVAFNGKEQILRIAEPGSLLGFRALLMETPHESYAEIVETARVCSIPAQALRPLIDGAPPLLKRMLLLLGEELGEMEERCVERSHAKAEIRLAFFLFRYLQQKAGPGRAVVIPLSRQEIADWLGTASETVIRLLGSLQRRGLVRLRGRLIEIPNRDRMQSYLEAALGRAKRLVAAGGPAPDIGQPPA